MEGLLSFALVVEPGVCMSFTGLLANQIESREDSAASGLTGKPPEQSQFQGGMGKIFHTRLKPNGFVQNALVVREALETRFPVISPHAAGSPATERTPSSHEIPAPIA